MEEILFKQPTVNIGTIGSVSNGKTTLVAALTAKDTRQHKEELATNKTIHLGYANCKIYRCDCTKLSYQSTASNKKVIKCELCHKKMLLVKHLSIIDCPGHSSLMSTMLSGVTTMNSAVMVIAANEQCPRPQTVEHLAAAEAMELSNAFVVQNKIDLVVSDAANENRGQIQEFIEGTVLEGSPIIPISAQMKINIQYVCYYLDKFIANPELDPETGFPSSYVLPVRLPIIRSFDVNKPGIKWPQSESETGKGKGKVVEELVGGVLGGSIVTGTVGIGDQVEIRPGIVKKDPKTSQFTYSPLITTVVSLKTESTKLEKAYPGGLIGVGTLLDPFITRKNTLVGHLVGTPGTLPPVYIQVSVSYRLFKDLYDEYGNTKVTKLKKDEQLRLNIGSMILMGKIVAKPYKSKDENGHTQRICDFSLLQPVCAAAGDNLTISRRINGGLRLIGMGKIISGVEAVRVGL